MVTSDDIRRHYSVATPTEKLSSHRVKRQTSVPLSIGTQIEEVSQSTEALTVLFMYFRSNRYIFRCQFQRYHKQSESGHPGTKFFKDLYNIRPMLSYY